MNCKLRKIKGFTLAEVLITLAVVGIVASIVVPGVINSTNDSEFKAAWKKTYAEVDHATRIMAIENGGILSNEMFLGSADDPKIANAYMPYFNVARECPKGSQNSCFCSTPLQCATNPNRIKNLDGSQAFTTLQWYPSLLLNNGVIFGFAGFGQGCPRRDSSGKLSNDINCGGVIVDVNGFKGPNTWGKDVFQAMIYPNRAKPYGPQPMECPEGTGEDCSAKYLME